MQSLSEKDTKIIELEKTLENSHTDAANLKKKVNEAVEKLKEKYTDNLKLFKEKYTDILKLFKEKKDVKNNVAEWMPLFDKVTEKIKLPFTSAVNILKVFFPLEMRFNYSLRSLR